MPPNEKKAPEANAKIEVSKEEFDQILQTELVARGITFSETTPERDVQQFFKKLPDNTYFAVALKVGDRYNVFNPTRSQVNYFDYQFNNGNEYAIAPEQIIETITDPVLVIEDLTTFTQKLLNLAKLIENSPRAGTPWLVEQERLDPLVSVWYNAAPIDFVEAEQFIDRYTQIMEGKDLGERFDNIPEPLQSKIINAGLTMEITKETPSYETPLAMMPVAMINKEGEQIPYNLSKVRTGIYIEDGVKKAVLYAVQNATDLKQNKTDFEEQMKKEKGYAQKANDLYKRLYREDKHAFEKVFGEIPEDIFLVEDPVQFYIQFKKALMNNLNARYPQVAQYNDMSLYTALIFQDNPKIQLQLEDGGTNDYKKDLAYGISSISLFVGDTEDALGVLENKLEIIKAKEAVATEISRSLRTKGVPPNHVASLTMALSSLQELGVEEVVVPLYLPLRVKDHEIRLGKEQTNELDTRKLNNLINELAYVSANVRGIDVWDFEETPEDGGSYMTLKLKPLSSDKPLLQEFVDAGRQVVGEKVD